MKSRRNLKKEIKKSFDDLYKDIIFYTTFVAQPDTEKANTILEKALDTENDLIKRISINEGKEVKGRVKKYFTELRSELKKKTTELAGEITNLPH